MGDNSRQVVPRNIAKSEDEEDGMGGSNVAGIPAGGTGKSNTDPTVDKKFDWSKGRPSADAAKKKAAGLVKALRRRDGDQGTANLGAAGD